MKHTAKALLAALACCALAVAFLASGMLRQPLNAFPAEWDADPAALGLLLMEDAAGLQIIAVWEDSPAQQAGAYPGDRLTALNGSGVHTLAELEALLLACTPETGVTFTALRKDVEITLPLFSPHGGK